MNLKKKILNCLAAVVLTLVSGCATSKSELENFQHKFQKDKFKFETLVKLLDEHNLRVDYFIDETKLSAEIRSLLSDLDISDVSKNRTGYELESSWGRWVHVYFVKDNYNLRESYIGYHRQTSEMIEVWGLGEGWTMVVDYDFI